MRKALGLDEDLDRRIVMGFLAASAVTYCVLAIRFPLFRLYDVIPPLDYAKLTHYSVAGEVALLVAYAFLFALLGYLVGGKVAFSPRWVMLASALLALPLLFLYPIFAIDMFIYAVHTRVWLVHHHNPFLHAPALFPGDRWIGLCGEWINATTGYGPLWEALAAVPGMLAGAHHFLAHVLGLKVVAYLAYVLDVWILDRILRLWHPQERGWRLVYVAWNPLVLLELVGNGHNDGVMIGLILLSIWLLLRNRERWAHVAMALAVWVKMPALFLWGLLWVWGMARRDSWAARARLLGWVAGWALVTAGVFALVLWPHPQAWQAIQESSASSRAPQTLAILLAMKAHIPHAFTRVQRIYQGIFVLAYAGVAGWLWRRTRRRPAAGPPTDLVHAWLAVEALLLYVFASNWRPWYTTWLLFLAALSPSSAWRWGVFTLSVTAETGDVYWTNIRWRFLSDYSPLFAHIIGVSYVFGLPAVVAGMVERHRRRRLST